MMFCWPSSTETLRQPVHDIPHLIDSSLIGKDISQYNETALCLHQSNMEMIRSFDKAWSVCDSQTTEEGILCVEDGASGLVRQRAAILRVRFTDSFLLDIATEGLEAVTTSDKVVEYLSAD